MTRALPRSLPKDPDLRRVFQRLHVMFLKDAQIAHVSGYSLQTITRWRLEKQRIPFRAFKELAQIGGFTLELKEKQ